MWPKSGNIPKMISECAKSDIDWTIYPIKVVARFYSKYLYIYNHYVNIQ